MLIRTISVKIGAIFWLYSDVPSHLGRGGYGPVVGGWYAGALNIASGTTGSSIPLCKSPTTECNKGAWG